MGHSTLSTSFDTEQFVADCREAIATDTPQLAIRDLLGRTVSRPDALEARYGTAKTWLFDTLYCDDDLTILRIIWPPKVDLLPHDHQMWAAIGIYGGVEVNTYYRRHGDELDVTGDKTGEAGDVLMLGTDGIHSVYNPTRQWTAAFHVYGGDYFSALRTQWREGVPEPFDVDQARATLAAADAAAKRGAD
jgi:predicted metal-dependent enzyme (double-stranded beta helix superfamily)